MGRRGFDAWAVSYYLVESGQVPEPFELSFLGWETWPLCNRDFGRPWERSGLGGVCVSSALSPGTWCLSHQHLRTPAGSLGCGVWLRGW